VTLRPRFATALFALALVAAIALPAFAGNALRTLVVRGLVAKADGKPAVGARVSAKGPKGGVNVSATTDERGRFSLQMPMGSPTAIRAAAFSVEVRAEDKGKRLPLTTGAPALGLVVDFEPGTSRLRVRSNSPAATAAVITAFVQDGAPTAWVDADFGGAVRANGDMALNAEDEIGMAGIAPAPGGAEREPAPERVKPVPVRTPAPIKLKPPVPPAPTPAPTPTPAAASTPAPTQAPVKAPVKASAPAPRVPKPAPDSAAIARAAAQAAAQAVARAEAREREAAARRTRDSLAAVRRQEARDAKRAAAAKRKPATPTTPAGTTIAVTTAAADSTRPSAPQSPSSPTSPGPAAPPRAATPRVVAIEPFAPPPSATGTDTCACRLRGTVEVDWERPLEKNIPVELTLEGPARQSTSVDLYMGPPREFRLGPLPCGEYKLTVRPRGRYRYALVRGDSVLTVRCDGHTQQRIVLEPVKR